LTTLGVAKPAAKVDLTPQDVDEVVRVLEDKWKFESQRLAMFLTRNMNIAAGVEGYKPDGGGMLSEEAMRPTTAMSDRDIVEHVLSTTTPNVELRDPVDEHVNKAMAGLGISSSGEIDGGAVRDENAKTTSPGARDLDGVTLQPSPSEMDGTSLPSELDGTMVLELPTMGHEKSFGWETGLFEMEP